MVVFYVKNKVSGARDGYEVAGLLKEKIGNEEGFFEFGLLKVEPYSKYLYSLHNRLYFFTFFRRAKASAKRAKNTRHARRGKALFFLSVPCCACLTLLARFALAFVRRRNVKK